MTGLVIGYIVFFAVLFASFTINFVHYMHMFQLNSYSAKEQLHWIKINFGNVLLRHLFSLLAVIYASIIFIGSESAELSLSDLLMCSGLMLIGLTFARKKKAKKKVDMMQRYQQLLAEQNGTAAASAANNNGVAGAKLSDDDGFDIKLSKSQQKDIQSKLISENRKKVEDKYRDEELTEEENRLLEEARRRQAEKYGDN